MAEIIPARQQTSSKPEDIFVELFTQVFGLESIQFLSFQHPFEDIYGGIREIDYAIRTLNEKVAFEIDGLIWHVPDAERIGKYEDDLLRQNSLIHQGWRVFRWTDRQIADEPEQIKEQLALFLERIPGLLEFDDFLPKKNLASFKPDDFGYLIVDEAHYATADSYQSVLKYFKPRFTLGLTATPERADGLSVLEVFRNAAHRLSLREAVQLGELVPIRCVRVETNIDLTRVRFNEVQYNRRDIEEAILVPGRDRLIVDTYLEHVRDRKTVVFCVNVRHGEALASLFQSHNIPTRSVSGRMPMKDREAVLDDFATGTIRVLCACDLLNEGWDCPDVEVLFMARPTLSKNEIDVFNWQESVKGMISSSDLEIELAATEGKIRDAAKRGAVKADHELALGERTYFYFRRERIEEIRTQLDLPRVDDESIRSLFLDFVERMDMAASYKPVMIQALIDLIDEQGRARLDEVARKFLDFYLRRQQAGLLVERPNTRMANPDKLTLDIARDVMLSMPFRKFEQRKFLQHDRQNLAFIRFAPSLWRQLKPADLAAIKSTCETKIAAYYERLLEK